MQSPDSDSQLASLHVLGMRRIAWLSQVRMIRQQAEEVCEDPGNPRADKVQ